MTQFQTVQEICKVLKISFPSMGKTKWESESQWDSATSEAIALVTERNPPDDLVDARRKRLVRIEKMESLSWLASDKATDMLQILQRYTRSMTKSNLKQMSKLSAMTNSKIEELLNNAQALHVHCKMTNAIYSAIVLIIRVIKNVPREDVKTLYSVQSQKMAKEMLAEIGVVVEPNSVHKPSELCEDALYYYEVVYPELYNAWRGRLAGNKFNF